MNRRRRSQAAARVEPSYMEQLTDKWTKGLQRNAVWEKDTFEEFPVCVHWFRQIAGLLVGVVWGLVDMQGFLAFCGGVAVTSALTSWYYTSYIGADVMSYGDWVLHKEGLTSATALFLLGWVLAYTHQYREVGGTG